MTPFRSFARRVGSGPKFEMETEKDSEVDVQEESLKGFAEVNLKPETESHANEADFKSFGTEGQVRNGKPKVEKANKYAHLGFESNIDETEMENLYAPKKMVKRPQGEDHFYGKTDKKRVKGGSKEQWEKEGGLKGSSSSKFKKQGESAEEGEGERLDFGDEKELKEIENVIEERDRQFHGRRNGRDKKVNETEEGEEDGEGDEDAMDEDEFDEKPQRSAPREFQNRGAGDRGSRGPGGQRRDGERGGYQGGDRGAYKGGYQGGERGGYQGGDRGGYNNRGRSQGYQGNRDGQGYQGNRDTQGYQGNRENREYPQRNNYRGNNPSTGERGSDFNSTPRYNDRQGGYSSPRPARQAYEDRGYSKETPRASFKGNNFENKTSSYKPDTRNRSSDFEDKSNRQIKREYKPELDSNKRINLESFNAKGKNKEDRDYPESVKYARPGPIEKVPKKSWEVNDKSKGDGPQSGKPPGKKSWRGQDKGDEEDFNF